MIPDNDFSDLISDLKNRLLLMLSKNVVYFCQKGTTDKKKHFSRCPKRSLLDHQLLDRVGLSKSVVFFYC